MILRKEGRKSKIFALLFFYKEKRDQVVQVDHVTKIFKLSAKQQKELKIKEKYKVAMSEVSFAAKEGEILGLLGPNGAGKTTALRCISTLLKPTKGRIQVEGFDSVTEGDKVRENIAFLTTELKLDPQFTPQYLFTFFGRLHGLDDAVIEKRRQELFPYFGIQEFAHKRIEELSTGMKQKVSIAVSLLHDPKVIIFDEPTNGLDIITARAVTNYLQMLKKQGKVVIISTHIMSEIERLCDRMAMIISGKVVFEGTLPQVYEMTGQNNLEDAFFSIYRQYVQDEEEKCELETLARQDQYEMRKEEEQ